jgi:hypothetical protein
MKLTTLVLHKGSSGSWVVNADLTKVYGIIVATDCFGDIWMVRMTDVMQDIQEEYDAVEVAFASHFFAIDAIHGVTAQREVGDESATLDSEEPLGSLLNEPFFPVSQDHGNSEEEEVSLSNHLSEGHASADDCQHCSSDISTQIFGKRTNETLANSYTSSVKPHTRQTKSIAVPTIPSSYQSTSFSKGGEFVWQCSSCGDGPYGTWQVSCQGCGHAKCGACTLEEIK